VNYPGASGDIENSANISKKFPAGRERISALAEF
jgi:hypothetical protein